MSLKKFVWTNVIVTLVLLVVLAVVRYSNDIPAALFFAVFGFSVLVHLLYNNAIQALKKSPQRFVTAFMASVTIKLLATAAFVGILIYFDKAHKVPIALVTMGIYVVYTILLSRALMQSK